MTEVGSQVLAALIFALFLPILALKNSRFLIVNVQIFINYQNVNFRDQKQMQRTIIAIYISFLTRNTYRGSCFFKSLGTCSYVPLFVLSFKNLRNWKLTLQLQGAETLSHTVAFSNPPPLKISRHYDVMIYIRCLWLRIFVACPCSFSPEANGDENVFISL